MKVSVYMPTYNHEAFVSKAIDSVLMQRTSFDYEIVIGEDCSTDRTREIVRSYAEARPDVVRPIFHRRNIGVQANALAILAACRGEYVALLEGDDYWISDQKLQRQVALLDARRDAAGCFANSIVVNSAEEVVSSDYFAYQDVRTKPEIRAGDIVPFGISPAGTLFCRRSVLTNAPRWFKRFPSHCGWDLLITLNGPYLFLNETVSAYRLHSESIWSSRSLAERLSWDLRHLKWLYCDESMREKYGSLIQSHLVRSLDSLLTNTPTWPDRIESARHFWKFMISPPMQMEMIALGAKSLSRRLFQSAGKLNPIRTRFMR